MRDAVAKNNKHVEDLKEQYKRATSQAERDRIRKQLNDADRDFLANEKLEEGNKLYYAEDYDGAIKLYNEAIQLNPKYFEAYNNRGLAYKNLGQYERAIADFDKAIALKPNFALAYYIRGNAYTNLRQYERAIADATKAIQINPKFAEAYHLRGLCYQAIGDETKAQSDFAKAKELGYNG